MTPISASAIPLKETASKRREGLGEVMPRAATEEDIAKVLKDYRSSAERAMRAGFDGVELHCGFGYLLD